MASIVARNGKFCVVHSYENEHGERKQKWKTFASIGEAKKRKAELEYKSDLGAVVIPKCKTLDALLSEYVALYGKTVWSISMYASNTALIRHYVSPLIGNLRLTEITSRTLEKYYATLLKTPAVAKMTDRKYDKSERCVTPHTVRKIHALLRSAFHQAMKWDLMDRNPATIATVPKAESKKREIWDAPTLFRAMELCKDERLRLCLHLAFACSLRMGEILGLTWDCVDLSEESLLANRASIFINKELQRVSKTAMKALERRDVLVSFPEVGQKNKTALVLKKPKTASSVRKVFLPCTVAQLLLKWKEEQGCVKEAIGDEYRDFNLVVASPLGMPTEGSRINDAFRALIEQNNLPKVVFHSLRHTSITYKLKLSGGDIKAVQGDSGHSQAKMVTDQYSHILDESRQENARLFEEAFYGRRGSEAALALAETPKSEQSADETARQATEAGIDPALLVKLLQNPEMVQLLKTLASTIDAQT